MGQKWIQEPSVAWKSCTSVLSSDMGPRSDWSSKPCPKPTVPPPSTPRCPASTAKLASLPTLTSFRSCAHAHLLVERQPSDLTCMKSETSPLRPELPILQPRSLMILGCWSSDAFLAYIRPQVWAAKRCPSTPSLMSKWTTLSPPTTLEQEQTDTTLLSMAQQSWSPCSTWYTRLFNGMENDFRGSFLIRENAWITPNFQLYLSYYLPVLCSLSEVWQRGSRPVYYSDGFRSPLVRYTESTRQRCRRHQHETTVGTKEILDHWS